MPKKIIYVFLTILTVVAVISPAFTASAYEITGFEVSASPQDYSLQVHKQS